MSVEPFSSVFSQKTGVLFRDQSLLKLALTHDSCGKSGAEFERMEFLGDACLELTVAAMLVKNTNLPEGQMTQIRSKLTRKETLAAILRSWHVEDCFILGSGMDRHDLPESTYADFFESILGALFLDQGHDALSSCVGQIFLPLMNDIIERGESVNNHKSRLQEHVMSKGRELPVYTIMRKLGSSHNPTYVVGVKLYDQQTFEGQAHTIKGAEQMAAQNALKALGLEPG